MAFPGVRQVLHATAVCLLFCVTLLSVPSAAAAEPNAAMDDPDVRAWLEARQPVRVGVLDVGAPWYLVDPHTGSEQGITIDILRQLSVRSGVEFEVVPVSNVSLIVDALLAGEIDMAGPLAYSEERAIRLGFSPPWAWSGLGFWVPADSDVQAPSDLDGRRVATLPNLASDVLRRHHPDVEPVLAKDQPHLYSLLERGEVAAIYGGLLNTAAYADGQVPLRPLGRPDVVTEIRWATSGEEPAALEAVNAMMGTLHPDDIPAVFIRWTGHDGGAPVAAAPTDLGWLRWAALALAGLAVAGALWVLLLRREVHRRTRALVEQDARLRAVMEHAHDALLLVTGEGIIEYANPAARRMCALPPEGEVIARFIDLLAPDDRDEAGLDLMTGRTPPGPVALRVEGSDGIRDVDATVDHWETPKGTRIVVVMRDVTARRASDAALAASEARYRLLAEHAGDIVLRAHPQGTIDYVSPAADRILGIGAQALVGQRLTELLDVEGAQELERMLEVAPHSAVRTIHGLRLSAVVGRRFETTWQLVPDDTLGPSLIGSMRDVTDRERLLTENREQRLLLHEAERIAALGSWTLELGTGRMTWSDGLRRLLTSSPRDQNASLPALLALVHEDDRERVGEEILRLASAQGATEFHFEHRIRRDGDTRLIQVRGVLRDAPETRLAVATCLDITELRAAGERFRRLLEAAPDAFLLVGRDGAVRYANQEAGSLFGTGGHQLVGVAMEELVPRVSTRMQRAFEAEVPVVLSADPPLRAHATDGHDIPVEVRSAAIHLEDGPCVLLAVRDIRERVRALEAQRTSFERLLEIERLREEDRFKTHLLNTASHELNTPLTPIRLQLYSLRRLREGEASPREAKALAILDRNVDRLGTLVRDILDVARLQAGHLVLRPQSFDLAQRVREAVESFDATAEERGVGLDVVGPSALPLVGDPVRLDQVIFNLVSNALKFTPTGGDVRVQIEPRDDDVVLTVQDTGRGLEAAQIERLFQPFSQVHDANDVTESGTGLGLYITRGIVEAHGGAVECTSDGRDTGATFTVILPRTAQIAQDAAQGHGRKGRTEDAAVPPDPISPFAG